MVWGRTRAAAYRPSPNRCSHPPESCRWNRCRSPTAAIHGPEAGPAGDRAHTAHVLVPVRGGRDRPAAIDAQRADGQRIGPGGSRRLVELQDVDGGIVRERGRVDHEEEPAGLVVEIARFAIERLAGHVADAVEPVLHDVAL